MSILGSGARAPASGDGPQRIALSLVSHTNAGKTTLARTLLLRDVGTIRDEPHVTMFADAFELGATPEGDRLVLWDTPGFGDSTRLAARLEQSGNPIGWMIGQLWDRFRDRPLWSSQQAVRNVRDEADVVLYLANAAEDPRDASYVAPEMRILDWIGKPVIVLLNQTGQPRPELEERDEIERWRTQLADARAVRDVRAFDAFARCWVQEIALFDAVRDALAPAKRAAFERLVEARRRRQLATFDSSMRVLAERVARAALDTEPLAPEALKGALANAGRKFASLVGIGGDSGGQEDDAMGTLAGRLDADIRESTDRLIALHGLEGHAGPEVLARLARHFTIRKPVPERLAAILGGLVTGAGGGLATDLAAGGMTLGIGLLAGGILGALGAAGLARGYNVTRGRGSGEGTVTWADSVLDELLASALIAYLAVAHYGRGRGEWTESEHPAHWGPTVRAELDSLRPARDRIRALRTDRPPLETLAAALQDLLAQAAQRVFERLYPEAQTRRAFAR